MQERRQTSGSVSDGDVVVEADERSVDHRAGCGEVVVVEGHVDGEAQRGREDDRDEDHVRARRAACRSGSRRGCGGGAGPNALLRVGPGRFRLRTPRSRTDVVRPVRSSALADEGVDLGGGVAASNRCEVSLAEDDRERVRVAEGLPDLDRVRHVGHLDVRLGLVGEDVVAPGSRRSSRRRWSAGRCAAASGRSARAAGRPAPRSCELQELPRGALVLAGGVHPDVLRVGERVDLLGGRAVGGRHRARCPSRPCRRKNEIAHGPAMDIAALPSANESPV